MPEQIERVIAPVQPHLRIVPAPASPTSFDEFHGGKSGLRRSLERVVGLAAAGHPRAGGTSCEDEVAEQLERLPGSWRVVREVNLGPRRGEAEQLVIGPGGAFTLHPVRGRGPTVVYERTVLQNGHETEVVKRSLTLARQLQTSLGASAGRRTRVRPLLVVPSEPEVQGCPTEFSVVASRDLRGWFSRLPTALTAPEVEELARLARSPRPTSSPNVGGTIRGYRP